MKSLGLFFLALIFPNLFTSCKILVVITRQLVVFLRVLCGWVWEVEYACD